MKKQFLALMLVVCIGLAFGYTGPVTAEAGSVKLTYSNFFPPGHIQSKLAEAWCKEVETRTNGQVVVEYFPGQTLTKARQVYDGVVEGISDVGFSVLAYTRGRFPVMSAVDLPLGYTSGTVATKVINAVYKKFHAQRIHGYPGDVSACPWSGSHPHQEQTGTQDGGHERAQVQRAWHQRGSGQSPGRHAGSQTHAGNLPDASKRRGGWCGLSV